MQRPNAYRVGDVRLPLPGEKKLGGHAMCMVGYVDDQQVPGGGYFIVRNSWGEAFGYDGEVTPGYCRIPYDYVRQYGMEAFAAHMD
jgi:C1A family cysteine protease